VTRSLKAFASLEMSFTANGITELIRIPTENVTLIV